MSAKHTPGPWIGFIDPNSFDILAAGRPGMIASCPRGDGHDADANARLIAAAPDMLAALYKIAQGGSIVCTDWPASPAIDRETMCGLARATILKATGAK